MKAYLFPGQGAQFSGMGKDLYDSSEEARQLFQKANEVLGFDIASIMFSGSADDLKQTRVTQPAIFIHSVVLAKLLKDFRPDKVAGHSLGEFSALVAAGALRYEDGLQLVYKRALAMQQACEATPSTMAAVLGLDDTAVEEACAAVQGEVVVAANYNCPGQLVISGSHEGVAKAGELLKERGAKRVLPLQVGGAFHSPLMEPAREELQDAILKTQFQQPICPIYQNVNARPAREVEIIKQNLIAQLTAPVRWTQTIQNMVADGATEFVECGPGKVLQGLVKKIHAEASVSSAEL
ncbi:ACP S-malonyltransferase [Cesiribacter andamanensis]|uniref:Malonyl CoA-acyl carrier protein transacylase n=1 Tax=Cesiribacter andamanensis AMV16 TaxID=1279009 RepID=M7N8A0_9BACT|nr:ACP S-malonyltransferase [Cesiribacter andamanensis]EMR04808.1 Malonyl CoA-acyl carrier protein transacylase [Cesiribacter andamanensis AMV16]